MTRLRAVVLAALCAAAVPGAARAATVLSAEPLPTRVAAWDGTVVWSQLDPATGDFRLVQSVGGAAPSAVGVPERHGAPFDVDLGTNRSGAAYAVYTRDGDLYRLSIASGVERRVDKLSSPKLAERYPTIQRGQIAFIRRDHGDDQLRIGDTTGATKGSRLIVKRHRIVSAELGITHVAYVEQAGGKRLVHIRNLRTGRDQVVYRAGSGALNAAGITKPGYDAQDNAFVWVRTNRGSNTGNRIVRYRLRGSRLTYAQGSPRFNSSAWAGPRLGAATSTSLDGSDRPGACDDAGVHYCFVAVTGPLSWSGTSGQPRRTGGRAAHTP